jgi:hypothetical protein
VNVVRSRKHLNFFYATDNCECLKSSVTNAFCKSIESSDKSGS